MILFYHRLALSLSKSVSVWTPINTDAGIRIWVSVIFFVFFLVSCSSQESRTKSVVASESVVEDNSTKVKLLLSQGNEFLRENKFNEAIQKFQEANLVSPSTEGYYLLGLSYLKNQETIKAKEVFTKGLELNPKTEIILTSLGLTYIILGDEENARIVYSRLTEYYPKESNYNLKLGITLKSLKRYEDSYSILKQIKEKDFKDKMQLYIHLGDVCISLKKFSEALEYYTKAKQIDPKLLEIDGLIVKSKFLFFQEKGIEFYEKKNFSLAILNFVNALVLKPDSSHTLLYLGKSYFYNNQFDKSEESLKKSLELNEKNREIYVYLSQLYAQKQNFEKVISNYLLALKYFPDDVEFYNQLGLTYKKLNQPKLALLTFIQAKELNRNYLPVRKNLALTLLEESLFLESKREFDELYELTPKDEVVLRNRKILNSKDYYKTTSSQILSESNEKEKSKKATEILNKFDSYLSLDQKEKCLSFLQDAWKKETNLEIKETIGVLYTKLGQDELALQAFKEILQKNPESHISYYQIGILSLPTDRQLALRNFEKAIVMKKDYSNAYIARGITYYKLGNRQRAKEDFYYALSIEPNLEIASYNLGMILYNDNLQKDAETIFLDLTKKYPDFADPYYHLGYMYYEQRELEKALKYILISLNLERSPVTIYAYIKILEELKKIGKGRSDADSLLFDLKKEIVENFPNSTYAKSLSESVLKNKENRVVIQSYPLFDTLLTPPLFINQTLIVNYGNSITRLKSETKSSLWTLNTSSPYLWLRANTRLYGLTKSQLDQIDLETGKILWSTKLNSLLPNRLEVSDSILFSAIKGQKEILFSYSFEGEFQSNIELPKASKWELTKKGSIFLFHDTSDGLVWEILDSKLNRIKESFTLLGTESGSISVIGSVDNSCYVLKGNFIYRFGADGTFSRSGKIEDSILALYINQGILMLKTNKSLYSLTPNLDKVVKQLEESETLVDNNTYLSRDGVLSIRDNSGKLLWSENISLKNKSTVFSVYYKK